MTLDSSGNRNVRDDKEVDDSQLEVTQANLSSFSNDVNEQVLENMAVHCLDSVQMKLTLVGTPHHQRAKSNFKLNIRRRQVCSSAQDR